MSKPEARNDKRENENISTDDAAAAGQAMEEMEATSGNPQEAPDGTMAEDAVDPAQLRIAELENELATLKDQALRALAEAENTRRRAVKEREDASKFAVSAFAKDLLDFADNFGRALKAMPASNDIASEQIRGIIEGISAMDKELLTTLQKHGIVKIEPMDEKFDPNFHEVMFEAPMPDKPSGTIIELIEPGYLLHGRLLRPARVGVVRDDGQGNGKDRNQGGIDTHA